MKTYEATKMEMRQCVYADILTVSCQCEDEGELD